MNIIEMKNITKTYSDANYTLKVLDDITVDIEEGSTVAVVGPSGSGKTTFLNILGLVIKPTVGNIKIDGIDVNNISINKISEMRNRMFGYIVQDYALIEGDNVYENIVIPLLYSKDKERKNNKKKYVNEIAEILGIGDMLKKPVKKLSGGQRQRVAIARALVNNQKIILADEPLGSLDKYIGKTVFEYLENLVKEKRKTLIMVTHNLELAKKMDYIYLLENGKLCRKAK